MIDSDEDETNNSNRRMENPNEDESGGNDDVIKEMKAKIAGKRTSNSEKYYSNKGYNYKIEYIIIYRILYNI